MTYTKTYCFTENDINLSIMQIQYLSCLLVFPFCHPVVFTYPSQPVEYADDVIMEVKNATQAALENIKMMGMNSILESEEQEGEKEEMQDSGTSVTGIDKSENSYADLEGARASAHEPTKALESLSLHPNDSNYSNSSRGFREMSNFKPSTQTADGVNYSLLNGDASDTKHKESDISASLSKESDHNLHYAQNMPPHPHKDISLSKESIEEFRVFQDAVLTARSKPATLSARRVSFSSRGKRPLVKSIAGVSPEPMPPWVPGPDDILGFLLPAYLFLADCEDALVVMVESDSFQVVVNFLQRSLSLLLESKVSTYPEVSKAFLFSPKFK